MAASFLRGHGVELDDELERIQRVEFPAAMSRWDPNLPEVEREEKRIANYRDPKPLISDSFDSGRGRSGSLFDESNGDVTDRPLRLISNVCLPGTPAGSTWDVELEGDTIRSVAPHSTSRMQAVKTNRISGGSALLAPSLCHPHVHIDKAFLLSHPKYAHLQIRHGDFQEAMKLTEKAKAEFSQDDLMDRGQRVVDESVAAGVTHMRAFVEVDAGVDTKCLDLGLALRERASREGRCAIQICAFAQLPLFSPSNDDRNMEMIRSLMEHAASLSNVGALGSTPYVEKDRIKMEENINWMIDLAIGNNKHLDFHLDYNLDIGSEPMIRHVISALKKKDWISRAKGKTVVLGHCTRLTLLQDFEWRRLKGDIGDLPISFVGLPTSDLYMMRTPDRTRGTLDVPKMIKDHGLNACIGINNIGNAFTPQGSCDPLTLACNGVGIYQSGTKQDAELLYECVSTRARQAIGFGRAPPADLAMSRVGLSLEKEDEASFVLFRSDRSSPWRTRRSVEEAVYLYDSCSGRRACYKGRLTS